MNDQTSWSIPVTPDGKTDWDAGKKMNNASPDFYWSEEEKLQKENQARQLLEDYRKGQEAALEREKLRKGISLKSSNSPRELFGRQLGEVSMRAIEWLWVGWIPKGYITLFAGETGAGKSTIIADITARITTGRRIRILSPDWPSCVACLS